ncbi:hypothetical protein M3Y97_00691100 [Aphelenchoides bicaudatus]|nr:hypothetical protein M3Y97_00691100 [Aphelenchoides bicaudatus]
MPGEESNPIQIDDDDEIKQEPVNEKLNATYSAVVSASSDVEQNIPTQQNIPAPANNQQKCIRCKKGQVVERRRCKTCLKKLKETNAKARGRPENMIDLVKRRHEKTDKRVSFASSSPEVVTIQETSSSSTAQSKTKTSTAQATPTHTVNESAVQATSTTQSGKRKRGRPAGTPVSAQASAQAAVQPPAKRGRKASTDKGNCTNCEIRPSLCRKLFSRCYSNWYVKSKREGTFVAMKTYPPNRRSSKKAQEAVVEVQMQHDDDQSSDTNDPSYVEDEDHELLTLDDTPPETPNDQVQHLHTQKASQVVVDLETQKVELVETAVRKTTQVICNNCGSVLKNLTKNRPLKTRFCKSCYQSLTKEDINNLRICKGCHLFRLLKGNGKCGECLEQGNVKWRNLSKMGTLEVIKRRPP